MPNEENATFLVKQETTKEGQKEKIAPQEERISVLTSENASLKTSVESLQAALQDLKMKATEAEKLHADETAKWNQKKDALTQVKLSTQDLLNQTKKESNEQRSAWQKEKQQLSPSRCQPPVANQFPCSRQPHQALP